MMNIMRGSRESTHFFKEICRHWVKVTVQSKPHIKKLSESNHTNRWAYWQLIAKDKLTLKCVCKWEEKYSIQIDTEDVPNYFLIARQTTNKHSLIS